MLLLARSSLAPSTFLKATAVLRGMRGVISFWRVRVGLCWRDKWRRRDSNPRTEPRLRGRRFESRRWGGCASLRPPGGARGGGGRFFARNAALGARGDSEPRAGAPGAAGGERPGGSGGNGAVRGRGDLGTDGVWGEGEGMWRRKGTWGCGAMAGRTWGHTGTREGKTQLNPGCEFPRIAFV